MGIEPSWYYIANALTVPEPFLYDNRALADGLQKNAAAYDKGLVLNS
jgi:hypothetical protein